MKKVKNINRLSKNPLKYATISIMKKENSDWFNDSSFWEQYAPIMFDEAHWQEVPAVADGVINLARLNLYDNDRSYFSSRGSWLNAPLKLLDICCGIGRMSAEFARRDFEVTGIDITESYLQTAREDAVLENLKIDYIKCDAREFVKPEYFDIAVNLYNSFGFFADPEDDLLFARNAYKSLKDGGCFIIETFGKEIAVRDFTEGEWFDRAGFKVLTRYKTIDSWSLLQNTWILINSKDGKQIEKTFTQRLYAASELRALLKEAGFAEVEIYGNWDEGEYDINADRLIVVGRK